MPARLYIFERRDNGTREKMAQAALDLCRIAKKTKGITSARYYWTGDSIATIIEGERTALNDVGATDQQNYYRAFFTMVDNARLTLNLSLTDAQQAVQTRDVAR